MEDRGKQAAPHAPLNLLKSKRKLTFLNQITLSFSIIIWLS